MIEVLGWGVGGMVVDLGIVGRAWLGSPRGGAVDADALAFANRLVGNMSHARGFESCGGLVFRLRRAATVAVTGGVAVIEVVDGPPLGASTPVSLPAHATVRIGAISDGCRVYVAVRGGLALPKDDVVAVGADPLTALHPDAAVRPLPAPELTIWPGPRLDWFVDDTWQQLLARPWRVGASSRVGVRLEGTPLIRLRRGELPSEGIVEGAIQVPPDGQPIVMLADHPTTGGYPVVAVVDPADLAAAAQARPGGEIVMRGARRRTVGP
ncbi:MAG: biotin-dependent carboxyltransferase family protein [Ilumatobacteraceae bacterium]